MPKPSGYTPSVWDRLLAASNPATGDGGGQPLTLEQLKTSVARDLEGLLNTRVTIPEDRLAKYPASRKSVFNYGLRDFAGMCLTSSEDRKVICDCVKAAIARFEPRLGNVSAEAFIERGATNQLQFVISGTLKAHDASELVRFDAMLQPSNLHYAIRHAMRGPGGGEGRQ